MFAGGERRVRLTFTHHLRQRLSTLLVMRVSTTHIIYWAKGYNKCACTRQLQSQQSLHCAAPAQVQPWWSYEADSDHIEGRQLTGKPSVFFRKTVNAHTSCGRDVAVNAQQYAVLVMDVPDLRPPAEE